jgi:hypothetical protein
LIIGRVERADGTAENPAALRCPRPAPGQHSLLPLAIALRTTEGWRPAVAYFQGGALLGFQIVAQLPADAAPPALTVDSSGDLYLAWLGLDGTTPHLYTASTAGKGLINAPAPAHHALFQTLGGALPGILPGLVWLILPSAMVLLSPPDTWTLPLALALYGAAKLAWPRDLLAHTPPLLNSIGLTQVDPGLAVGTVVLGTSLLSLAALGLFSHRRRPLYQQWFVYALLDCVLTWTIFGANLLH